MRRGWLVALMIGVLAVAGTVMAQDKESVTVIRQGAGGEIQVISKEQSVGAPVAASERAAAPVEAAVEEAPRKARVAVIPAVFAQERRRRIDRELNERFGITDPGVIESPGFTSYVIDALVNARKFDMLEREELRALTKEIEFGESDFVDPTKAVKIGSMVGADYIIIPEIRYLETERETKQVPYVGGTQVALKCKLGTTVRTVDVKTGKIISSNIGDVEKKERQKTNDPQGVRIAVMELISDCFRETAIREAANIVDVAYPIRLMSIDGDTVMINRGKGAILQDEVLKVYAAGEVMVDPDTKDNLGYQESYLGSIKVTEVGQKTSKAVVVEQVSPFSRLSICRRQQAPSITPAEQQPQPAPKID